MTRLIHTLLLAVLSMITATAVCAQRITLQPEAGKMACTAVVPQLSRQAFILGLPETIGSSEGMILNFPDVSIAWEGPDSVGALRHVWTTPGKISYTLRVVPFTDHVDAQMTIRNLGASPWTNVFSFNCLNPGGAPQFQDWTLQRTYMSKGGRPCRLDSTTRINAGPMSTVQFYVNEGVVPVSPFVSGFQATSPDRTDDSYMVTMAADGASYMAATSPASCFLFNNLDRCCIHSATNFGSIPAGQERSVTSRFYMARGSLSDFRARFHAEMKAPAPQPRVLMCHGDPWELADTAEWPEVAAGIDVFKFYIDGANPSRVGRDRMKAFLAVLLQRNIRIAVELGGLVDWHADKGDRSAECSFQDEYAKLQPFIALIKEIDAARNIDMLDMDGPIRRMLFPNNVLSGHHTLSTAVTELFEVAAMWRDSIPGAELNLLVNFPNWAWGRTPAYYEISGQRNGYGQYMDVLDSVQARSLATGRRFDGLTVDNPYDYVVGTAASNQPAVISGVDWMQRLSELDAKARSMGLKVNMIFNTNGGRDAQGYSEQSLAFIDLYHARVGAPDGYWVQSWYQLPDAWLPESTPYTMTHLTREVVRKLGVQTPARALLEPEDGRVYHGAQLMTYESGDPLAGYLGALSDSAIQPASRGLFFSIPGTRGPAQALRGLIGFLASADSIGFVPELSLFLVSDIATDSIIAVSDQYDWIIDSVAALSAQYGRRMFLRIGGEFNGVGPGWNGGGYHPHQYVTMFRKITDRFAARGMRDSVATIWCYYPAAANDFDSVDARGALWYPGDGYVDWFGLDLFDPQDFDLSLPDSVRGVITRKGKSERFLAMARSKGKPVYMSETSAKGMNISADAADGAADWNAWFAKFWAFIDAHPEIKGFSYINANWPASAYPGWGDARIQNSPYVTEQYRAEMRRPKYIHLPWSGPSAIDAPDAAPDGVVLLQLSPHPAASALTVRFVLPHAAIVRAALVDLLGREVLPLGGGFREAGAHTLRCDLSSLPAGTHFLRIMADGFPPLVRIVTVTGRR